MATPLKTAGAASLLILVFYPGVALVLIAPPYPSGRLRQRGRVAYLTRT